MTEIIVIGKLFKSDQKFDGFDIIAMDLKLAEWKDAEKLHEFIQLNFFFDLINWQLTYSDIEYIITTLENTPLMIYEKEEFHKIEEDIVKLKKIHYWLKSNFPYGSLVYDIK
jgi:hypothetical protein